MEASEIVRQARDTEVPITDLVRGFFDADGPIRALGWEVRQQQVEMATAAARLIDDQAGGWSLVQAPTGTGKGLAYLIPGLLQALRDRALWERRGRDLTHPPPNLVVSTANIALQQQLTRKDIPALASMLGVQFDVVLLKGKNNYVCRNKISRLGAAGLADERLHGVLDWIRDEDGCTGDREDLPADVGAAWPAVSSTSEECTMKRCAFYAPDPGSGVKPCFWQEARRGWKVAHVVVCNHHYLALDGQLNPGFLAVDEAHELEAALRGVMAKAVKRGTPRHWAGRVKAALGEDAQALLCDPVDFLIDGLTAYARDRDDGSGSPMPVPVGFWADEAAETALAPVLECVARVGRWLDGAATTSVDEAGRSTWVASDMVNDEEIGRLELAMEGITSMYWRCRTIAAGEPRGPFASYAGPWAVWVEPDRDAVAANLAPADVSGAVMVLRSHYPRGILTSATLAVAGSDFAPLRLTLGMGPIGDPGAMPGDRPDPTKCTACSRPLEDDFSLEVGLGPTCRGNLGAGSGARTKADVVAALRAAGHTGAASAVERRDVAAMRAAARTASAFSVPGPVEEVALSSPFDLPRAGLLVVPHGPSPKEANRWRPWAVDQVCEVVRQARGRTLVLCSSIQAMRSYAEALRARVPAYPVRAQGEAGRGELRAWFTSTVDGVLVASKSFFAGLDVQGESCSCVVIDRVPFRPPGDPLEEAVGAMLVQRAGGGSAYQLRSVPEAAITLAQQSGRLIRSSSDRGVVVVLDNRIMGGAPWSETLRRSLPPFPVSRVVDDVGAFLDGRPLSAPPPATRGGMRRRPEPQQPAGDAHE